MTTPKKLKRRRSGTKTTKTAKRPLKLPAKKAPTKKKKAPAKKGQKKGGRSTAPTKGKLKRTKAIVRVNAKSAGKKDAALVRNAPKLSYGMLRELARVDYAQDQTKSTIPELWARDDRQYKKLVKLHTFTEWAKLDQWVALRKEYWREWQKYSLNELLKDLSRSIMAELRMTNAMISPLEEYMQPLTDSDGNILRHGTDHEFAGLPVYPLKMPSMKDVGSMLLKFYQHRATTVQIAGAVQPQTGEAEGETPLVAAFDPVSQNVDLSPEQIAVMARALLEAEQPDLKEEP